MQLKKGVRGEPDSQKWVRVTNSLGNPGLTIMYLCINNDVSCIISAISFSITARIIVTIVQILQLFQKFKIK